MGINVTPKANLLRRVRISTIHSNKSRGIDERRHFHLDGIRTARVNQVMRKPRTRLSRIVRAVVSRIVVYGAILVVVWWWMLWTPGPNGIRRSAWNAEEAGLEHQLRSDVDFLAGTIGERNVPGKAEQLDEAAAFIFSSMNAAGYQPVSQWYSVSGRKCRNIEAEIRGADRSGEVVIVGAHYDTVPGSPGADDNATGVAVMLALARIFVATRPARTLRFVGFVNEEPPYFWSGDMGSLVYAKKCREHGDRIVAMLSLESVGFYSSSPKSQRYPAGLGLLYPSTGDFVAFVGNVLSRSLVHEAIRTFRSTGALRSIGAAIPNAVPGAGWSDHWSFWKQGFAAIEITDTAPYRNPYYHTPDDTPDRLNYDHLARFTWAMQAVVKELANPSPR